MAAPVILKPLEVFLADLKRYKDSHQFVEGSALRSDIRIKRYTPPSNDSPVVPSMFTGVDIGLGSFMGRIRFKFRGEETNLFNSRYSSPVPHDVDLIEDMSSDALFILLLENDSAYFTFQMSGFFNVIPCIVVKSKNREPNVYTGLFLKKMYTDLKLPVFALMDWNPNAFNILAFYGRGSEDAYGTSEKNLKTPDIKWLGMKFGDYHKYNLSKDFMSFMTEEDANMAEDMLEEDLLKKNPAWADELKLMLEEDQKDELEAFGVGDLHMEFLVFHVLQHKLQQHLDLN